MTLQKKNNYLISLIGIGVTAIISFQAWIVSNIIVVREDVATIKAEIKADHETKTDDHATVSMLYGRIQEGEGRDNKMEKRIDNIEAILPEILRKKQSNF